MEILDRIDLEHYADTAFEQLTTLYYEMFQSKGISQEEYISAINDIISDAFYIDTLEDE